MRRTPSVLSLLCAFVPAAHVAAAPCGIFTLQTDRIGEGVYVVYQPEPLPSYFYLQGNVTVIVNDQDVVVVDAGSSQAAAACVIREIRKITPKPVTYLINTHWHGDHTLGNAEFLASYPGAQIIASTRTADGVATQTEFYRADLEKSTASRKEALQPDIDSLRSSNRPGREAVIAAYRKYIDHDLDARQTLYHTTRVAVPTLTFDGRLVLQRGSRTIDIREIGPGDAPGSAIVFLPQDHIVATGDLVTAGLAFGSSNDAPLWRKTLGAIDALDASTVVPGHGSIDRGKANLHALMRTIDTLTATVRNGFAQRKDAPSIRASMDAASLGAPIAHGDPVAQFFFEGYFLDPIVPALFDAIKWDTAGAPQRFDPATIAHDWHTVSRSVTPLIDGSTSLIRFDENSNAGMVWNPDAKLADGDIDFDVRGRDLLQKSFVGVAFHIQNDSTLEVVYLRPFNFRSADTARAKHAVQYASYPAFPWERLRAEHPGAFEAPLIPAPNGNDWVHVRVAVRGPEVRVFINHAPQPALTVTSPGPLKPGGIGLWVGSDSNGDFANLTVRRLDD